MGEQAKVQARQQKDSQQNALAIAKANASQPTAGSPGSETAGIKKAAVGSNDNEGVEAKRALQAGGAEGEHAQTLAKALAGTVAPMLARLKKISAVADAETRAELLQKFLADHAAVAEAVKHDDSLTKQLTAEGVAAFVAGLKKGKKP